MEASERREAVPKYYGGWLFDGGVEITVLKDYFYFYLENLGFYALR